MHNILLQKSFWGMKMLLFVIVLSISGATIIHAQGVGIPQQAGVTLTTTPTSPLPGEPFTVRADTTSFNMARATLTWFVNGIEDAMLDNEREVEFVAPQLGNGVEIEVLVSPVNGPSHTKTLTIIPSVVDLIIEADTVTPMFYRGRHLPSADSETHIAAIPHIYDENKTKVTAEELVYRWSIGGRVLKEGIGAQTLSLTTPSDRTIVRLDVEGLNTNAFHTAHTVINPHDPEVIFYENNPLYGLSRTAIQGTETVQSDEITVRAVPYFLPQETLESAEYTWSLDRKKIDNPSKDPQDITLRTAGDGSRAQVHFLLKDIARYFHVINNRFTVLFTEDGGFLSNAP